MNPKNLLLALGLAAAIALPVHAVEYSALIPAKSEIRFGLKQMNVPTEGKFHTFTATVHFDPAKPEKGSALVEVDTGSIDLGTPDADSQAKTKNWFNIASFPKARFQSSSIKSLGNNHFEMAGKLTIKGISKDIVAPFTVKTDAGGLIAEGSVPIQRLSFKVGEGEWADTDTVANEVQIKFRLALAPKK